MATVSNLGGHNWSLQIFRPYSRRPVADGHKIFVLSGISLDAIDRTVMLACTHVKYTDAVVLLPVTKIDLFNMSTSEKRGYKPRRHGTTNAKCVEMRRNLLLRP